MNEFYRSYNANTHRGAYTIAEEATDALETTRRNVARFINSDSPSGVVFTKNVTESINLVARSWGGANLGPQDTVLITEMEHHGNIVPWHIMAAEKGFKLRWIPLDENGRLDLSNLEQLLDGVKLVSISAASNVLGTVNPIRRLADAAHAVDALILADAAQYVPHLQTDVQSSGVDFLCFTGHKMCGPTGVGVLWGRSELLEEMTPFLGGGNMILDVTKNGYLPNELPYKFEAGTLPIAEIIGLGAAVEYLTKTGMQQIKAHEEQLTAYALHALKERCGDDIVIHGPQTPDERIGVLSIAYNNIHPHDLAQVLNEYGVCVRAGHHCAKPLMRVLGVNATTRVSLYLYNDTSDVDTLIEALHAARDLFTPSAN